MTTAPHRPPAPPQGWEDILDPGERILWQGRPEPGLLPVRLPPGQMVMGAIFTGFSLFWMSAAGWIVGGGDSGGGIGGPFRFFPLFGLPFLLIGLYNLFGFILWRAHVRRHTWYTLTDRRAYVATALPLAGRRLKSWPITADTVIEFDGADPATIVFAHEMTEGNNGVTRSPVGFERIRDGRSVYRLMRGLPQEQPEP